MANIFYCLVTATGRAKLAQALASGEQIELTAMSVGDGGGNSIEPSDQQTALAREVYRSITNRLAVSDSNPNRLIAELLVPAAVGGWVVREVGVWDADGDLFAVGNFPATYKPDPEEGATQDLIVRVAVEFSGVEQVSLSVNAAVVIASRQWVVDNFLSAPGGTTGQMMRKRSNADHDVEWFSMDLEGLDIQFDTREEVQTLADGQTVINWAEISTQNAGYYVDGSRLRPDDDYTITGPAQITLTQPFPENSKIHGVQNDQAAGIPNASQSVPGLTRYASPEEALGSSNNRAMTPARVKQAIDARGFLSQQQHLADLPNKKEARKSLGLDRFLPRAAAVFAGRITAGEMANVYYHYSIPAGSNQMEIWREVAGAVFGFAVLDPAPPSNDQLAYRIGTNSYGAAAIGPFHTGNRIRVIRHTGNGPATAYGIITNAVTETIEYVGGTRYRLFIPVSPSSQARSGICYIRQCFKRSAHNVGTVVWQDTGRYFVNFVPNTFLEDLNTSFRLRYAMPVMADIGASTDNAFVVGLNFNDPASQGVPMTHRCAALRVERLDDSVRDAALAGAHFFEVE